MISVSIPVAGVAADLLVLPNGIGEVTLDGEAALDGPGAMAPDGTGVVAMPLVLVEMKLLKRIIV